MPFFVRGGAQWAEGRGEELRPAAAPPFAAAVVVPALGLSTARGLRGLRPPAAAAAGRRRAGPEPAGLAGWVRNDLLAARRWPCAPALGRVARALRAAGAGGAALRERVAVAGLARGPARRADGLRGLRLAGARPLLLERTEDEPE